MKNLTLIFALGFILLTSCAKDKSYEPIKEQTIDSVYELNQFIEGSTWETILINEAKNTAHKTYSLIDGVNAHKDGYYITSSQNTVVMTRFVNWFIVHMLNHSRLITSI